MGCGMSTEDKEGKERNEQIENQLKRDKMSQRNEIKMLLLGRIAGSVKRQTGTGLYLYRSWRVGQINHLEADEAHPRRKLFP